MDHDQRFKTLIQEFFGDFLSLFFEDWAARMDLSTIEWLGTEVFYDPPEGKRHHVDLIAKVPFDFSQSREEEFSLLLVHIEIESPDQTTLLKTRFSYYYHFLRDKYKLPVLPIALFLKVGLDGIGVDTYVETTWNLEVSRFQFLYVGLPGLDGVQYLKGDNWLGIALSALMKIPKEKVAWLGAEALQRIAGSPLNTQKKFLLGECVQAYLALDEQQKQEYETLLRKKPYRGAKNMSQTIYESIYEQAVKEGRQEGRQEGLQEGRREERIEIVTGMLKNKFEKISQADLNHLQQLSMDELWELILKIGNASNLKELGLSEDSGET